MVTRKTLEKYMNDADAIAEEIKEKPEVVVKVLESVKVRIENGRRQSKPPPPEGGISIRAAGRKYNIPSSTLAGFIKKGFIAVLERTRNWTYLKETDVSTIAKIHNKCTGRGNKTITKLFQKGD